MAEDEIMPIKSNKRKKYTPKDEIMAKARAEGSTKTDAYLKANPKVSYDSARALAPEYIKRHGVDERALQLLAGAGLSEEKLARSLNECVDSADERIKLDSTKFGLGMIGYGKDQRIAETSYNPTQINIIIRSNRETNTPNPNDTIEIQANEA